MHNLLATHWISYENDLVCSVGPVTELSETSRRLAKWQTENNQRDQLLAQALQKSRANPSYLEFFGLQRPPFDRLSDLAAVFHTEQYTFLLDHLAKAALQSDYLVAICGADGCGKTTLLDKFLLSLSDDLCIARFDESYKSVKEFYCEFLRQLGFHDIDGKPDELRRITREFIVNRGMASEPVVLVIDNAHLISPFVLEQLRWLSAIRVDEVRVISCVLAGNSDLMRIMDSAAMSQFAFNNYIRFHIRAFSEAETMDYVRRRLNFAGCSDQLSISNEAQPLIHRFSGGIPRMINILCDAVLQDACSSGSVEITGEMLRNVADERHLVPHVLPYQGKGRRRSDPDFQISDARINDADVTPGPSNENDFVRRDEIHGRRGNHDVHRRPAQNQGAELQRQIARLSSKLNELKGENRRLTNKIASRDADLGKLRDTLQVQAAKNAELEQAYNTQSGTCEKLSMTLTEQVSARERSDETNRHLVETLRQDQLELSNLRARLADAGRDSDALSALRIEAEKLRSAVAGAERDKETILRLEQEALELREQVDQGRSDKETILRLEQEALELRKQVDQGRSDKETILRLEQEALELREQVDQGRSDKKTITRLSKELDQIHARLADAICDADAMAKMQDELLQVRQERDTGRDEVSRLQAEVSDALEALANVESELESARAAQAELLLEARTSEQQRASQTAQIRDLEAVVEAHDQDVEALLRKIDELEIEQLAVAEELNQFASLEAYANDCESQLAALKSELERAQHQEPGASQTANAEIDRSANSSLNDPAEDFDSASDSVPIRTIELFRGDKLHSVLRLEVDQRRVMIGRDDDNDLVLDSNFISRHHAILSFRDDGTAFIEDLNSLNGVLVNKSKRARADLRVGDVVILGDFCLLPGPA